MKNTKKLSIVLAMILALNGGICTLAAAEEVAEAAPETVVTETVETEAPAETKSETPAETETEAEETVTEETVTEEPAAEAEETEAAETEVAETETEESVAVASEAPKAVAKSAGSFTLKATVSAVEGALESFKAAVLNGLNANMETIGAQVTFTQDGDTVKAEFGSFLGLIMGTYGADNTWTVTDNGEHVRLNANVDNGAISLSDTVGAGNDFGYKLYNVDYSFTNSTIVRNDDSTDSFSSANRNDDGYFHFASMGHVTMTFDGCDLKQNVQSGTTGTESDRNIDLIFRNCDFNGNSVLSMTEQVDQRDGNKDPFTMITEAENPIYKSYQGDNIGSLIIENCTNLRSINATGASWMGGAQLDADHNASKLSVTNSTFIDSRNNVAEGTTIGDMLVFGQHFSAYEFAGNTWTNGGSIFAVGFHSDGFVGGMQADSFYQQNELVNSKWAIDNDSKLNNAEHWLSETDGANTIVNANKGGLTYEVNGSAHNAFYVYGSIGEDEPEEEPAGEPTGDPTITPKTPNPTPVRTTNDVTVYSLDDYATPLAGSSGCSEGDCFN